MVGGNRGVLPQPSQHIRQNDESTRLKLRRRKSVPVLDRVKACLDDESRIVLPRSPMVAAIGYVLNLWDALSVYATHGFLVIDDLGRR